VRQDFGLQSWHNPHTFYIDIGCQYEPREIINRTQRWQV
jgi:hypothetical protein